MTATATQLDIPAGFAVVQVETHYTTYHDGDNYATGETVTLFNPATGETLYRHFGPMELDRNAIRVDGTAGIRWAEVNRERREWCRWYQALGDVFEGLEVGGKAEVYRGRKVPKGEYTVKRVGSGRYGDYADLADAQGKLYSFVSLDNLRVPAAELVARRRTNVLENCPAGFGEVVWAMMFPNGEYDNDKLGILCDYIEDGRADGIPSDAGRWIREAFYKPAG